MLSIVRQCPRAVSLSLRRRVVAYNAPAVANRADPSSRRNHSRSFFSSRPRAAALAQQPPSQPTVLVVYPSQQDLEAAELDAEVVSPENATIDLTDRAAEQLRKIASREGNSESALRISVESGGCHGYQYKMELTTQREPEDFQFTHPAIQPANVIVDAVSLNLLNGSTIDFATELIGSSFRVMDNPQSKGPGCGCGVSWEANV